jgi:hypothetical protein
MEVGLISDQTSRSSSQDITLSSRSSQGRQGFTLLQGLALLHLPSSDLFQGRACFVSSAARVIVHLSATFQGLVINMASVDT